MKKSFKVTYYHRRPGLGCYSIERLFTSVRQALSPSIRYSISTASYPSKGFFRRLYNCIEAVWRQSDVNHITGDIHYVAAFLSRKKTILTIHDCVMLERLHGVKKKILWFFWYWMPAKRSALITVVSKSTKKELLRYLRCNPQKIRVVQNCVTANLVPSPREFNSVKPRILHIGTTENKNLSRIASALEGISCHLRIIGKLSDEQKMDLGRHKIEYSSAAGVSDEELGQEYNTCDLVLFASTYEGFGLPIIEANAVGRPVITSNIFSMPEVAGEAACLVDPFDVQSIREGILRVIEDSDYRTDLIREGFRNVKRFHPDVVADQYAKIYEEIYSAS